MVFDFEVKEGMTRRIQLTGLTPDGTPYDYTSKTIEFIAMLASGQGTPDITFSAVVSGAGVLTSTPASRIFLGRQDPTNKDGPLIDTVATSGYLVIRFAPEDTINLANTTAKVYFWEARVLVAGGDNYPIDSGKLTVTDSLFSS